VIILGVYQSRDRAGITSTTSHQRLFLHYYALQSLCRVPILFFRKRILRDFHCRRKFQTSINKAFLVWKVVGTLSHFHLIKLRRLRDNKNEIDSFRNYFFRKIPRCTMFFWKMASDQAADFDDVDQRFLENSIPKNKYMTV
jgi:hypothetical protein